MMGAIMTHSWIEMHSRERLSSREKMTMTQRSHDPAGSLTFTRLPQLPRSITLILTCSLCWVAYQSEIPSLEISSLQGPSCGSVRPTPYQFITVFLSFPPRKWPSVGGAGAMVGERSSHLSGPQLSC